MAFATLERSPPPFFRQGPSAAARLVFYAALSLLAMALDARWHLLGPLRLGIDVAVAPVVEVARSPWLAWQALAGHTESLDRARSELALARQRNLELALAAQRGVGVDIVVPARSNHRLVDWASAANIRPLLDDGVRIWRNPAPFDHSKMMVVDGVWCLIGSANWDMRSFRLNFELNMEVFHDDLAATLGAHMAACRGPRITSEEIAASPLPIRLRNAAARLLLPYL